MTLPRPYTKDEYCKYSGCLCRLNPYGICPNQAQHVKDNEIRRTESEERRKEEETQKQAEKEQRKKLWDSVIWYTPNNDNNPK